VTQLPRRAIGAAAKRLGAGRTIGVGRAPRLVFGAARGTRGGVAIAARVSALAIVERIAQRGLAIAHVAGGDAARARRTGATLLGFHAQHAAALDASDRAAATAASIHAALLVGTTVIVVATKRGAAVIRLARGERDHENQREPHAVTLPCSR
jgi:hypothetical protein